MEDICTSMIKSEVLFLIPILFSVRKNLEMVKEGKISKRVFIGWYALCLIVCGVYEFTECAPGTSVIDTIFTSIIQGLLIGSFSLNLKNINMVNFKLKKEKGVPKIKEDTQKVEEPVNKIKGDANIEIKESLIKLGSKARPGEIRKKKWIVIHETGNIAPTAGAANHAKYISNLALKNEQYLSWHYTVDDKEIFRHIPDNEIAWHAGDGRKEGGGNMNGIGIEICVNKDSNFNTALKNAAWLVATLMKKHNITIENVQQHHFFNGKNCPEIMRRQGLWNGFIAMCKAEFAKMS